MEAHAFWSNLDDALLISYKRYFDSKNQEKYFYWLQGGSPMHLRQKTDPNDIKVLLTEKYMTLSLSRQINNSEYNSCGLCIMMWA
jgi:hypothetical protein